MYSLAVVMAEIFEDYDLECCLDPIPEIGRNLCRVSLRKEWIYGGYKKDILTEKLSVTKKIILICTKCDGIMKDACVSSSGENFCSGCEERDPNSKQIPNISVRKVINSLKCSCPLIGRGCEWLGSLESCENHLDTCGYVLEKCELECGVVLIREELRIHEKEKCPNRMVKCEHCMKDFKSCELDGHLEKCPKMKVSCDLECGAAMCREDMEQHLKRDCGMVRSQCNLGCRVRLTRNDLKIHEKVSCVRRIVQCDHCFADVRYWDIPKHLKECPKVRVACELCSVEIYREYMTEHIEKYCPEEMVECPFVKYKCMTRIKREDMDKHLEEKETKHLGLKLIAMEDLITKQSEKINEQSEKIFILNGNIEKLNKENDRQNKEMKTNLANTSQRIELLYSITDTTVIVWTIEKVSDLMKGCQFPVSKQCEVAGYKFRLKFETNGELRIVFPETTSKYDKHFIAKCHIVFSSCYKIDCGLIEVRQKDLMRGCDRIITTISKQDVDRHSIKKSPRDEKRDLTLEIFITKQ